ncbi:MAG: DUF368 domain-containing protein [Firmicutes bacterium]|nr:DUF368 domain-containing protein [Bacillota bacterium]
MLLELLQGIFIGVSLVLPGMSGGTALIILGFYHRFLEDISKFNIKKYFLVAVGIVIGVFACALTVTRLLNSYPNQIVTFLMGMLLASIILVLNPLKGNRLNVFHLLFAFVGFALAWMIVGEPLVQMQETADHNLYFLFGCGIVTAATMLLPGVSGSSLLILLNLYDELLQALVNLEIWPKLVVFALGLAAGLVVFARIISMLYKKFKAPVSLFLAGLLLGSTKALFPEKYDLHLLIPLLAGFLLVHLLSRDKSQPE